MEKNEIVEQTKLAFEFIQRLYLETSYLVREIEGILKQEEEEFQILKPRGYHVSTSTSTGLEPANVEQWLLRKGAVCFAAKSNTKLDRGQTTTKFVPDLRVIVVRFLLWDRDLEEPEVWAGVVSDIHLRRELGKFETGIGAFTSFDRRAFRDSGESTYADNEWVIKLSLIKKPLYDISSTEDIQREIIAPVLRMYRSE